MTCCNLQHLDEKILLLLQLLQDCTLGYNKKQVQFRDAMIVTSKAKIFEKVFEQRDPWMLAIVQQISKQIIYYTIFPFLTQYGKYDVHYAQG